MMILMLSEYEPNCIFILQRQSIILFYNTFFIASNIRSFIKRIETAEKEEQKKMKERGKRKETAGDGSKTLDLYNVDNIPRNEDAANRCNPTPLYIANV